MPTITAKYPGTCANTGRPIRVGDRVNFNPTTRALNLLPPVDTWASTDADAQRLDERIATTGRGLSRAQAWRRSQNARYGAGLDHEVE